MQYTDENKKIYSTISIFSQFSGVSMKKIFIPFLILCSNNILPSVKSPQQFPAKTPPSPSPLQRPQSSPQPQQPIPYHASRCPTVHHDTFSTPPPLENLSLTNTSFPAAPPLPDRIGRPMPTPEHKNWGFRFITEDYPDSAYTGPYPVAFSDPKNLFILIQNLIAQNSIYPRIQITSIKLPHLQQLIIQVCMAKSLNNGAIRYTQNCVSKFTIKYFKNHPDAHMPADLSIFDIFSEPKSSKTTSFNNETSADISLILAKNPNIAESEFIAQILNVYQSATFIKEAPLTHNSSSQK